MNEIQFGKVLRECLIPMLPGVELSGPTPLTVTRRRSSVANRPGACVLAVRPSSDASFEYELSRSQKFEPVELKLVEYFVEAAAEIKEALEKPFETEVLRNLPLRIVARAAGGPSHSTVLGILEQFFRWAAGKYEGHSISVAVGLDPEAFGHIPIEEVWEKSFAPVISNGMDTLVVVDAQGKIARIEALTPRLDPPSPLFSPFRFRALAEWAADTRIAVALTRTGEILVFQNESLRFAFRSYTWHHFTHDATLSSIHLPHLRSVKTALYETLLDVSFARSGGCVAVVDRNKAMLISKYVKPEDILQPGSRDSRSTKAKLLASAVERDFTGLDRRIRAELLALDGATVLSHTGSLIAVGAIVQIDGGSTGGGRLAAAKALANLGIGVKISQDGTVTGFDANENTLFSFG